MNGVPQQRRPRTTTSCPALCASADRWRRRADSDWLRWASIFLGVAGTYRKHDSVDVIYEVGGRRHVATSLPVAPPGRGGVG